MFCPTGRTEEIKWKPSNEDFASKCPIDAIVEFRKHAFILSPQNDATHVVWVTTAQVKQQRCHSIQFNTKSAGHFKTKSLILIAQFWSLQFYSLDKKHPEKVNSLNHEISCMNLHKYVCNRDISSSTNQFECCCF